MYDKQICNSKKDKMLRNELNKKCKKKKKTIGEHFESVFMKGCC